jgi:hypothetical protein
MPMRIGFILGAGVSIPAGMPDTSELTTRALHVDNYTLRTSGAFLKALPGLPGAVGWETKRERLKSFLNLVRVQCHSYFASEKTNARDVNYEDLFFAANQLDEHLSAEYENPAMEPFAQLLADQPEIAGREQLKEIASLTCDYIQDVVAIELGPGWGPQPLGHLGCLIDAARDPSFNGCDVFTLNHDLLIESTLVHEGIKFVDGFGPPDKDVAWWQPTVFNYKSRRYFLKLHGSVNWLQYDGRLAKSLGSDSEHAHTADGKMLPIPDRSAKVLLGTFNKIRDYFMRPYFDLMATFRRQMEKIDSVIVSGYSFRDKGVNAVLSQWMRAVARRKILILHANGEQCVAEARGAIRNLWHTFGGGRMRIHSEYLNDCAWRELVKDYHLYESVPE